MRMIVAAALAALLLVACSSGGAPSPSASTAASLPASTEASPTASATDAASIPDGWELVAVEGEGFSVALPEGWVSVSPADLAESGAFDQMVEDNPQAAAVMEQARQAIENGQMSFLAFEKGQRTVDTGFAAYKNVGKVPNDGSATTEEIAEQMATALPMQIPGLEVLDTDTVVLPAGEAAVVRSRWTVQVGQAGLPVLL